MTAPISLSRNVPAWSRRRWVTQVGIAVLGLTMLASQTATPTPLYPRYAEEWSLSPVTISVVFAAYVLGLSIALVSLGALSDHIGRRPVGLSALGCAILAMAVLATADGVIALTGGRILQGLAAGLGMAAFGAAMVDHAPPERGSTFAALNSALLPIATGVGAVVSAIVLRLAGDLVASYVVQGAGIAVAAAAAIAMREQHPRRPGAVSSLRPGLVLPTVVRATFVRAAVGVAASWCLVGLYLGLGPLITGTVLGIDTPLASALAVASASGTGGLASVLTLRLMPARAMVLGGLLLLVASAGVFLAVVTQDVAIYFASSTIGGFGFGATFQGGLRMVMRVAPVTDRAGVLAALYLVSYVAFGMPSLAASVFAPLAGLEAAVLVYAALVAVLTTTSLVLGMQALRRDR
jgi:MFS family permease